MLPFRPPGYPLKGPFPFEEGLKRRPHSRCVAPFHLLKGPFPFEEGLKLEQVAFAVGDAIS